MRNELIAFFSDRKESTGLLVAEAPTGYGKTYETVHAIYQYVRNGGKSQVLFMTNLRKNLPVEELCHAYEQDGRKDCFEKEVLVLSSAASTVEQAILAKEEVPAIFQSEAYHALCSACEKKAQFKKQGGAAGNEMVSLLEERIRLELEPGFRRELERICAKSSSGVPVRGGKRFASKSSINGWQIFTQPSFGQSIRLFCCP